MRPEIQQWALEGRTVWVVYHRADLDGVCSAAVVLEAIRRARPLAGSGVVPGAWRLLGMDYDEPFPWAELEPGAGVVMVDFSLPAVEMFRLRDTCHLHGGWLLWYDHHATAMRDVHVVGASDERQAMGLPEFIEGVRDVSRAACEIAAQELLEELPKAVRLLGRWDVWQHEEPGVREFQMGMRVLELDPDGLLWEVFLRQDREADYVTDVIEERMAAGETILEYQQQVYRRAVRTGAHLTRFEGLTALACNGTGGSELFADAPHCLWGKAEVLLTYVYSGRKRTWVCGLYHRKGREDVDCGELAKRYGGGGHKGAAGFRYGQALPPWAEVLG